MIFQKKNPKVFIISGKAKSGKDTVCKMIMEYYGKEKCIELAYAYYLKDYAKRILSWDGREETKPREFLQNLGIELIKTKIDSELLIRRLCEDIEVFSYFYDVMIVTDARLIPEIELPKEKYHATILRVVRTEYEDGLTLQERNHVTETELDHYHDYDYVIKNDSDLEDLKKQVLTILKEMD